MQSHEMELSDICCHLESCGRVHMSDDDVSYMCSIKKLDNMVYSATTLVRMSNKHPHCKVRGYFADTLDQLVTRVRHHDEETLYDILDYSEIFRYVASGSYKCYALFIPATFRDLFLTYFDGD